MVQQLVREQQTLLLQQQQRVQQLIARSNAKPARWPAATGEGAELAAGAESIRQMMHGMTDWGAEGSASGAKELQQSHLQRMKRLFLRPTLRKGLGSVVW